MPPSLNPTKAFYDRISSAYDLIADASEHTARDRGIELLAPAPRERALVVGFGTGHSLVALARAVGTTGRIFGVDISEGMLSVARKRIVEERVAERVEISLGDARHLAYGNGQFDAVFIAFTLELFDDQDRSGHSARVGTDPARVTSRRASWCRGHVKGTERDCRDRDLRVDASSFSSLGGLSADLRRHVPATG